MSKSLYERYAAEVQPAVLAKKVTFEQTAEIIKGYKGRFSPEYIEWAEEICANMFGRDFEEVRDLVDGKPCWISIAGMYEERENGVEPSQVDDLITNATQRSEVVTGSSKELEPEKII